MTISLINIESKNAIHGLLAQSCDQHLFVYIGRCKIHELPDDMQRFYCYLPSCNAYQAPLHNPLNMHTTGTSRDKACEYFDTHFDGLLKNPSCEGYTVFHRLVQEAKRKRSITLICHCVPQRCHGMRVQEASQARLEQQTNPSLFYDHGNPTRRIDTNHHSI